MTIFGKSKKTITLKEIDELKKERIMDKKTLEQLIGYTKRAKSILESTEEILKHTEALEETRHVERSRLEADKIIIDIRRRLNNAEKIGKDCDNSFVLAISEIDMDLARYPDLTHIPSFSSLLSDSRHIKNLFVNNCKCSHKM